MSKYIFGNHKLNETLKVILSYKNIADIIIIGGGISAYIENGKINSKRKHHDFDLYINVNDMPKIREYFNELNAIFIRDSLNHFNNDKGCDIIFNGIKFELIPYILINDYIHINRAYYSEKKDKWDIYHGTVFKSISINHIYEKVNLYTITTYKIKKDFIYALKKYVYKYKKVRRLKDIKDIIYLKKIISKQEYQYLMNHFLNTKSNNI